MTIKDIAKQCSVSVSTVSRVLNDRPDVSEDVRRKVLSAIKNSNYIPNNSARDLVRTKSDAVGLVVRGVSNPFYTDIIRAIERTITDAGFTMVMQQIGTCDDEVKCGAVMEREKRLQGIVFLGGRFDYTPADLAMLNVPFVCCSYSNRYGTLIEGEYSSVSIADGDTAQQALESHGIPVDPDLVICTGGFGAKDAYRAVQEKMAENVDFTALFAIADSMAIGAMRALMDAGRRIPEDCSVIAIDGLELSAYIEPPLTTLCQPMEEMGRRSAEILLDMVRHKGSHACELLPTTLRQGRSVAAPR